MDTVCYKKWVQDTISCPSQMVTGSSCILENSYLRSREDSTSERGSGIHAIEPVTSFHPKSGYYSRLFLVRKKSGGWRPVIDLHRLKRHIITPHFKMVTLDSVHLALRKNDWAISLDLKDVYFYIPIHRQSRRYTRFHFMGKT